MKSEPYSIAKSPQRDTILAIQKAALDAVEPGSAVLRHIRRVGETRIVGDTKRVHVIGGGKAAQSMAGALFEILGDRMGNGLVIVKRGGVDREIDTGPIEVVEAAHPVPDVSGMEATKRIVALAAELDQDDLALVVIAGGASALMTLPADGVSLEDLQETTELLLRSGVTIQELNTVRKHLSRIKGGWLARAISPARTIALILSDVVGDPIDAIGSGPTVSDPTTFAEALGVLESAGIKEKVPAAVADHLKKGIAGEIAETPKTSDPVFTSARNLIVGSNRHAAEAAVRAAKKNGLNARLVTTTLEGEAREIGLKAAALAEDLVNQPLPRPACLVLGGETTVTVHGPGKGGRNQELALSAATAIDGLDGVMIVALATDGDDGPTDAAGAIATGETISRARGLGIDAMSYLDDNNAYPFFDALGDLIRTGPTGTNVADLLFIFAF
ncbi:MAG: glycerate kinase [Deltaproteobacteria bacterium]|nr:glycerate kinase [Deltaproteobacteria bacterium]